MTDLKTITDGLRHHIDRTCAGCPYSKFIKAPDGCLLGGLMPEALEMLTEQDRHINELHKGIVELRDAIKERYFFWKGEEPTMKGTDKHDV